MNQNDFWLMIILMIVFSYLVMNNIMLTFQNGIYHHLNKLYMALLMGALMGVISYLIMICHGNKNVFYELVIWIILSIGLIIMIRKQTLINDNEFLKGMIEHHDMALLMSNQILNKTNNPKLKMLAMNIITSQQKEIDWMQHELNNQ